MRTKELTTLLRLFKPRSRPRHDRESGSRQVIFVSKNVSIKSAIFILLAVKKTEFTSYVFLWISPVLLRHSEIKDDTEVKI